MKYLEILPKAAKQLASIPSKDRIAIISKLNRYATGMSLGLDVLPLKDRPGFRLRHGIWRAIFTEDNLLISVIKIGHRKDIY